MSVRPPIRLMMQWMLEDNDGDKGVNEDLVSEICEVCEKIDKASGAPCVNGFHVHMEECAPCLTIRFSDLRQEPAQICKHKEKSECPIRICGKQQGGTDE